MRGEEERRRGGEEEESIAHGKSQRRADAEDTRVERKERRKEERR